MFLRENVSFIAAVCAINLSIMECYCCYSFWMDRSWLSLGCMIISGCPCNPSMLVAVVHTAAAGGQQQSVSESTAGRLIVVGQVTAPLLLGRGSSGRGPADGCRTGCNSSSHGVLTGRRNTVIEVTRLGRRGCGAIKATAAQKRAFEFAAEFPCWKNDKLQQQDVEGS
jgi:hypothetical protein